MEPLSQQQCMCCQRMLPTACCLLPVGLFSVAYCLLTCFLLPAACCLLPITFCHLPFATFLVPTFFCRLPFAICLLPAASCLLPIPTAHCLHSNPTTVAQHLCPDHRYCVQVTTPHKASCPAQSCGIACRVYLLLKIECLLQTTLPHPTLPQPHPYPAQALKQWSK